MEINKKGCSAHRGGPFLVRLDWMGMVTGCRLVGIDFIFFCDWMEYEIREESAFCIWSIWFILI